MHEGKLLLEFVFRPSVITITKGDVSSLCALDGAVSSVPRAMVGVKEYNIHAAVFPGKILQHLERNRVGRVVVRDEKLQMAECLPQYALYAGGKKLAASIEVGIITETSSSFILGRIFVAAWYEI